MVLSYKRELIISYDELDDYDNFVCKKEFKIPDINFYISTEDMETVLKLLKEVSYYTPSFKLSNTNRLVNRGEILWIL